ncbi:histidine phosphatase family protein [Liquorilactobacillus vini]|uniref:histidine phosphatase family protein n=1 Tax=Liquorilactobacillus vini TaxID=238015 RepID=UPI00029AC654|nr:histidine phosphatase family protein [Liquorilactobacillus vini]
MIIYLIRHGEPDYAAVKAAGYLGFGRELAGLSKRGRWQAQQAAQDPIFDQIELLLSSPYPRALQTALELSRHQAFPVKVELGLHEWLPAKHGLVTDDQAAAAYQAYRQQPEFCQAPWDYETVGELKKRAVNVFQKYATDYTTIACVTHGELIHQFTGNDQTDFCQIQKISF